GCIRCACMQDTANASATLSKTTPERANAQGRARIAFRHAFETNHPERRCTDADFDQWQSDLKTIFHRAFPFHQAAGMLLAPVALPPFLQRLARSAAEAALRHALLSQKY
ncbi:MAG TPA: hypothetical protein VED83_07180, partial [Burkholderiaceae bacterium]|nr:hypothetical protein [Burkholderiaceae bacterium]